MEEQFEFTFNNGHLMYIAKGEEGYTVNILADEPLASTFPSFEDLLYGIAPIIQDTVADGIEFGMFTSSLYYHFAEEDDDVKELQDEIGEILMK